jgi:phosphoenolpyruvate synthase/pyruvate phosphate dikinase
VDSQDHTELQGRLYKQEASAAPFTCWPWALPVGVPQDSWFPVTFNILYVYFKDDYALAYWEAENLNAIAQSIYTRYHQPSNLQHLYSQFEPFAKKLEKIYYRTEQAEVLGKGVEVLTGLLQELTEAYREFWTYSLFIDSFDAGFDQEEIGRIAAKHNLNIEEIGILTTPSTLAFTSERKLHLLQIAQELREKEPEASSERVAAFVEESQSVKTYIKHFDYYRSNYGYVQHITFQEVAEEIIHYLAHSDVLEREYQELKDYTANQEKKIQTILTKHDIKENPLYFFNFLTQWREYRKQINLMGVHVLDCILQGVEVLTGIPYTYLQYLSFEEVELVTKGLVAQEVLRKRREGIVVIHQQGTYQILDGEEAGSLRDELEERAQGSNEGVTDIIGHVASQGYARGIARIVMDQNDFHKFKEGEILVTGMTRPEFVPVMKKAAAIVTNEGGITCHASIVSRELGKPCIIGTKNATILIKDGDLIEVRANHGTVRILQPAG